MKAKEIVNPARPGKRFSRRLLDALSLAFPAALLGTFSFFIFGTTDVYFANLTTFTCSLWQLMSLILPVFCVVLLGLTLLLTVCGVTMKEQWFRYICGFFFAVGIAIYVQGSYLSSMLDQFSGDSIEWNTMTSSMLLNSLIWIAIISVIVFMFVNWKKSFKPVVRYVSYGIVLIQLLTGVITAVGSEYGNTGKSICFSGDELFRMSAKENVIIFKVDTLDTRHFAKLVDERPEVLDILDGFTYYHNMGGSYRKTAGALCHLFSGQYYENQENFLSFCKKAFQASPLLNGLDAKNYDVRVMMNDLAPCFPDTLVDNMISGQIQIAEPDVLRSIFIDLLAYRYFPTAMTPFFFKDYTDIISNYFVIKMSTPKMTTQEDVLWEMLKESDEEPYEDRNAFRFFPLIGTHTPYYWDKDGNRTYGANTSDLVSTAFISFTIISDYMEMMKENGVYDSSTFIIWADHGEGTVSNPTFLIKYPGATGPMVTTEAPVSYADLQATLLKAIGDENYAKYGTPIDEWPMDAVRERFFYVYSFTRISKFKYYFTGLSRYKVPQDATDLDNYTLDKSF